MRQRPSRHLPAFRTTIGCRAKIVAAVGAEAGAILSARAEDLYKADRREDGEEESGEPVREVEAVAGLLPGIVKDIAEAEESP